MAYVENGMVKVKRPVWRLNYFIELFWTMLYVVVNFFKTMFLMDATQQYKKKSGSRGGGWDSGPGGGGSGGGPRGSGPRRPPRGLDNVRGIDHSSLPACGSCCGG